ncbi:IST1-like protein [Spatholobus suberectus]|nr:IST1-like protein [Spatholobus suberectus]
MFDILFGWSKASKCKKTIKAARCRLRLLKNKRQAIARQLRKDLAELIQSGHEETAFNRVEQLMEDESLAAAYELLDNFCEFILTQLSYIRRHKDCPNDINEAVSSLIFASARCGDLPELGVIRKLFGERYSERFAATAVELFPGNLVNKQLKQNLSVKSVPDDLKYRMVDEIARDNSLQQQVLAIQYYPDWQQVQVKENKGYQLVESDAQIIDTIAGFKVHPSEIEEIKRDDTCVDPSISKPSDSCSLPDYSLADTSAIVSAVQQYPPYIMRYPLEKKVVEIDFPELLTSINFDLQNKGERMALTSSAQRVSFLPYPEEMVDYVDDIKEFSVPKDGACQDQMLFKFRSSGLSRRQKTQFGFGDSDVGQDGSESENSSTMTSRKSKRKHEKRSRRSSSLENVGLMDIGYMIYYHKPCKSPLAHKHNTHYHRRHHKPSLEGIPPSSYCQKRLMLHGFSEEGKVLHSCQSQAGTRRKTFNFKMSGCSLDQPCYFCLYNDEDYSEAQPMKQKRGIRATHVQQGVLHDECCHCQPFWDDELNQGIELVTIPQRPNRRSYSGAAEYHVFNYPDCQAGKGNNETKAEIFASPKVSNPRASGSSTRVETETSYSRAMTMPQERHRNGEDKMLRTYSCPSPHPNHVHPKLPDYDDIAAKFNALKRERLENMDRSRDQNK